MSRNGNERKPSSSSSSLPLDCEVELGLKMQVQVQPTHSYNSCDGGPFFSVNTLYDLPAAPSEGCGKGLFTEKQWEELERQKKIHKYIVASIPVPPQLLLPLSQSASGSVDLRLISTSGSDPEPWRCKRTDGKKWRCSRDVAGDHKYCERHAHKTKPRSRKLVELSSHKPYNNILPPLHTTSFDHTRCMAWLMRGKSNDNTRKQQQQEEWEQLMHLSSSSSRSMPLYEAPHLEDNMTMNPYIPDTSYLELKSLQGNTTRGFIDAWDEKEGGLLSNNFSPSSSLTLSMCGGNDNENGDLSVGVMSSERESDGIMRAEWMNMNKNNSAPGGPLGEALCLGNASVTRGCGDGKHALNFIG